MASTGFIIAGTGANATGVGTEAWVSPGNVTDDDGVVTQGAPAKDEQMNYIVGSNFGLSVPGGSTINGIEIRVQAHDASQDASPSTISHAIVGKSNSTLGNDLEAGATTLSSSPANYTYGSSSQLWGLNWDSTDINASTFQARFSMNAEGSTSAGDPQVDAIWVNVHYTPLIAGLPIYYP